LDFRRACVALFGPMLLYYLCLRFFRQRHIVLQKPLICLATPAGLPLYAKVPAEPLRTTATFCEVRSGVVYPFPTKNGT
jgi:hypothetical protein